MTSVIAVVLDAAAVMGGFMAATWLRFDSGLLALEHARPVNLYHVYGLGSVVATLAFLLVIRSQGLFVRPQTGSFPSKIPRLVKAVGIGIITTMVLAFAVQNELPRGMEFSRLTIGLSAITIGMFLLLERYIMYRIEWNAARHMPQWDRVLLLGTNSVSARLRRTFKREPMLRERVIGFLRTDLSEIDHEIKTDEVLGTVEDLANFVEQNRVDRIVLTDGRLPHDHIIEIILLCERNLISFNMVPDLFRVMTGSMDVQSLDDIPLLGIASWPLDSFWRRLLKRAEDIIGALAGLLISAPIIGIAALAIKRSSPGPVFYSQERCGEKGKVFKLHKLRTMGLDAEEKTGPVFTAEDDPRRTRVGTFLRAHNLDELPQFWNVLVGDMSLVGPRPERPHFVEQFKEDISRYMWRHVSKPGITGWAQVNGLRGNTSITERIKYDLYYLENWSLALDFKILARTLFARKNAY